MRILVEIPIFQTVKVISTCLNTDIHKENMPFERNRICILINNQRNNFSLIVPYHYDKGSKGKLN